MANTFATPKWVTLDAMKILAAKNGNLFNPPITPWDTSVGEWCVPKPTALRGNRGGAPTFGPIVEPISLRSLALLGAAAVIASPRHISRRALLAFGWKSR